MDIPDLPVLVLCLLYTSVYFGNDTGNLRLDKDFISRFHFAGGYGSLFKVRCVYETVTTQSGDIGERQTGETCEDKYVPDQLEPWRCV